MCLSSAEECRGSFSAEAEFSFSKKFNFFSFAGKFDLFFLSEQISLSGKFRPPSWLFRIPSQIPRKVQLFQGSAPSDKANDLNRVSVLKDSCIVLCFRNNLLISLNCDEFGITTRQSKIFSDRLSVHVHVCSINFYQKMFPLYAAFVQIPRKRVYGSFPPDRRAARLPRLQRISICGPAQKNGYAKI